MSIAVLGGGAFGTALAIALADNGPVTLWARNATMMITSRENANRLPGCPFPETLTVTDDLELASSAQIILIAIPTQKMRSFLIENARLFATKDLVACCKGIEINSGQGPIGMITAQVPSASAALITGPSFAADIARGLPTALTLACKDDAKGHTLQQALTRDNLRLYRTTDTIGAELGGALKNVIAIACGTAMGAGLGESARAALMTRGFAEMQRLATFHGADPRTLAGLSGFGDLTLTCTSDQSRNYRLGLALGQGQHFEPTTTVEGAATARAVDALAKDANLDLPITSAVAALLDQRLDVSSAMQALLTRPLKEE